jgi:Asp-tRNA(Asn)/Glu-tRNA(Gln) amidotransferase B subunit
MKLAELFEYIAKRIGAPAALTWITGPISSNWKALEKDVDSKRNKIADIVEQQKNGKINDVECSMRLKALITGEDPGDVQRKTEGLDALIRKAISDNPSVVDDYKKSDKAANRIIGIVMKEAGGAYSSSDIVDATKKILNEMVR